MSEPHVDQKLMRILMNRPAVEAAYFAAHRRAAELRKQLRELELQIVQAQELMDLTVIRPWPPLPAPIRPPTLHEAISIVLEIKGNAWMHAHGLATEIARRALYRRRDGRAASPNEVSARISAYPGLFRRSGSFVRLRIDPPGVSRPAGGRFPARRTA